MLIQCMSLHSKPSRDAEFLVHCIQTLYLLPGCLLCIDMGREADVLVRMQLQEMVQGTKGSSLLV
jgi:hypothetical protein